MNNSRFKLCLFFFVISTLVAITNGASDSPNAGGWVKYQNNPVLGGRYGTCFDVSVLKDGDSYRMWFSWRPRKSIAVVESKDGFNWSEPVIVLGPKTETGWENDINRPVVIKRDGLYHMWYTGQSKGHSAIGYATSANGVEWKRMSDTPVLTPSQAWEKAAVMCPDVIWDDHSKLFRMWYSGGEQYEPDAIGYATSPDGLIWTRNNNNPIFKSDPAIEWERHKVTACQVVENQGWYLMFYIGFRDIDHAQIGVARSKDGITNWQRLQMNPIVSPDPGGWDADACYKPVAIFDGAKWLLWYNGRHGGSEQIGVATHEGEDLGFSSAGKKSGSILKSESFKHYVDSFNSNDREIYPGYIKNEAAWEFLKSNIPLFECPDKEIEQTYYFRWWTYRKHIEQTPDGFVITEFLPKVPWAGKDNSIVCAAGHHLYEGRWLAEAKFLNDYSLFWFRKGGDPRLYSTWLPDALWARYLVDGDASLLKELLPDLVKNYEAWEKTHLAPNGLFWQSDDRDGMEMSISGSGFRPTINSYMYGDAIAIAKIADLAGQTGIAEQFRTKAATLKRLVQEILWSSDEEFFEVMPRDRNQLARTRELLGYTPWYFNLPDADKSVSWKQLMDPQGFYAPYGPTTAEQRSPRFAIAYRDHECQWNGPSWPYATSVTLAAMANLLNASHQDVVSKQDYFDLVQIYTKSHHLKREDGRVVCWIDEDLDPRNGAWIARTLLQERGSKIPERGKDYNHSTYCDLVITGLVGLRPNATDTVEINPLIPDNRWEFFCLDNVHYHDHRLTILYDKSGRRYNRGSGLRIFADGKEIAASEKLERLTGKLN